MLGVYNGTVSVDVESLIKKIKDNTTTFDSIHQMACKGTISKEDFIKICKSLEGHNNENKGCPGIFIQKSLEYQTE